MPLYSALPTEVVRALQAGGVDANGQVAEFSTSDGSSNPCRHCLQDIPLGHGMLILAHRPFARVHPYAETGPVFLCSDQCDRWQSVSNLPPILATSPEYLIKGYDAAERIVYGTGTVVPAITLSASIDAILENPVVAFVHIRSARNNCYQARADKG